MTTHTTAHWSGNMHIIKEGIKYTLKNNKKTLYHLLYNHYQKALLRRNTNLPSFDREFLGTIFFKEATENNRNTHKYIYAHSTEILKALHLAKLFNYN